MIEIVFCHRGYVKSLLFNQLAPIKIGEQKRQDYTPRYFVTILQCINFGKEEKKGVKALK
jgi:hypothetical protein